jgi:hypothetical protein
MSDRPREARAELDKMRTGRSADLTLFGDDADATVESVLEHEGDVFKEQALAAVRSAAMTNRSITVVDVWARMDDPACLDRRAMGGIMRIARDRGWISPTGQFRRHPDPAAHARRLQVWRSNVLQFDEANHFELRVPAESGGRREHRPAADDLDTDRVGGSACRQRSRRGRCAAMAV